MQQCVGSNDAAQVCARLTLAKLAVRLIRKVWVFLWQQSVQLSTQASRYAPCVLTLTDGMLRVGRQQGEREQTSGLHFTTFHTALRTILQPSESGDYLQASCLRTIPFTHAPGYTVLCIPLNLLSAVAHFGACVQLQKQQKHKNTKKMNLAKVFLQFLCQPCLIDRC